MNTRTADNTTTELKPIFVCTHSMMLHVYIYISANLPMHSYNHFVDGFVSGRALDYTDEGHIGSIFWAEK
jgi:hypothetical protein